MADLPFTKPDGSKVWVPEESATAAAAAGYRPGDANDEPIQAGLEATARAATFGVSDPFLVGMGVSRKGLKQRKEDNPKAAFVGNVAGLLAPGGLPAKVGKAVAKFGAGSLLRTVAGAGAEGTLYGLEEVISEQALGDPNVNGERVAATMVAPALAGAVISGVTHGLGKGASALTKSLGGHALSAELENMAAQARKKVLGAQTLDKRALREFNFSDRAEDAIEWADRKGVFAGSSHESVAELAGREIEKSAADLADIESTLQRISEPDLPRVVSALRERANSMANTVTGEKQSKLLHDLADAFEAREKVAAHGELRTFEPPSRANAHYDTPSHVPESLRDQRLFGGMVLPAAETPSHGFTWTDLREELAQLSKEAGPVDTAGRRAVLKGAREVLRDETRAQMSSLSPSLGAAWEDSFKELGYGLSIQGAVGRKAQQGLRSLGDEIGGLAGTLAFSGIGSVPGLLMGRQVQKFAQQRGGYLMADALKQISETKVISKMAAQFEKTIQQRLATMPSMLGPYRRAIEDAAAKGTNELFQTHLALASSENGHDYLARLGIEKGDSETTALYGRKLATLNAIDAPDTITKTVNKFFNRSEPDAVSFKKHSAEEMMAQIKNLDFTLSGPEGVATMVSPDLLSHAPATGTVAVQTLDRALRVLQSAAPRDPKSHLPKSLKPDWKPNPSELDRWYDTLEAIQDPAMVFERMKHGEVPSASVNAIKVVYPQMFEAVRQQMADRIAESRKPVTYKQRLALASVFGPEFLGITPMQAQMLQQVHQKSNIPADGAPSGSDGRQDVDSAKNMETQAQRMEAR